MREGNPENTSSRDSGFTFIELLIVIAILGMIAAILTVAVSRAIKRQRLDTAAQQLRSFIDRAYVSTTQTGNGMFIQIGAVQTDGSRLVRLVEDNNSNQTLDSTDQVLATETITDDLVLSNSSTAGTAWPVVGGSLEMLCDSMGRAIDPTTGRQITQALSISLTHTDMTGSGTLRPRLRYDIRSVPAVEPVFDRGETMRAQAIRRVPEKVEGEKGSSLIEVLVALLIMLFLMIGILQMFALSYMVNLGSAARTELTYKCEQVMESLRYFSYLSHEGLAIPRQYGHHLRGGDLRPSLYGERRGQFLLGADPGRCRGRRGHALPPCPSRSRTGTVTAWRTSGS